MICASLLEEWNDGMGRERYAVFLQYSSIPVFLLLPGRLFAAALRGAFEPHLALEERVLFPAISALPAAERRAIKDGMRRRRET